MASADVTAALLRPVSMAPTEGGGEQDEAPQRAELTMEQLGIEVPSMPGNIALSGKLKPEAAQALAGRFKSWVNLNGVEGDPDFHADELKEAGAGQVEVRLFPGPPEMPSEEQVAAAMEALDALPRPMMLQCTSGNRVGVLLVLWLVTKRGYSADSMKQFASDSDFKFWNRCTRCGPMRDWLTARLPAHDASAILKPAEDLVFAQLFDPDTSTWTYLLGCEETKEALLIDPVLEQMRRDLAIVSELGLNLRYVVNTHCHADHVTSGGMIRKEMPEVKTVISKSSGARADILVEPGEKVTFGKFAVEAIGTPGHTHGCISWYLPGSPGMVFTGDALLIRGCGRTDFQQGSAGTLYESVHSKLFTLPADTAVYPGHDYKGRNASTVDEEKRFNPRLTKTKDEFIKLMGELRLPYPTRIDVAVPANLVCGVQD